MAYARPIRDIAAGDIFLDRRDNSRVIIVSAGNRYVEFMRGRDRIEIFYERHFRDRFKSLADHELRLIAPEERRAFKRQFCMSLANLERVRVYWLAAKRRITVRSEATGEHPRGTHARLPDDAHQVGTYAHPFNLDDFLTDLHDLISRLETQRRTSAAADCAR